MDKSSFWKSYRSFAKIINMKKLKISFDYDGCLAEDRQKKIAAKFIADGHDVYITTSRDEKESRFYANAIVFKVAEQLGIPKENIRFTNGDKYPFLHDFDLHFDDDQIEVELIEENTNCTCILIYDP